ncbi:MAG: hypothetical protein ACR2LL_13475 [Nitrosopumilus sp.]
MLEKIRTSQHLFRIRIKHYSETFDVTSEEGLEECKKFVDKINK